MLRGLPLLTVARISGVQLRVHPSWLVAAVALVATLGDTLLPPVFPSWGRPLCWLVAGGVVLGAEVSTLLHEVAHALAAARLGRRAESITFYGLCADTQAAGVRGNAAIEPWVACAGPAVNLALAGAFSPLASFQPLAAYSPGQAVVTALMVANLALFGLNLLPLAPFDGAHLARAVANASCR